MCSRAAHLHPATSCTSGCLVRLAATNLRGCWKLTLAAPTGLGSPTSSARRQHPPAVPELILRPRPRCIDLGHDAKDEDTSAAGDGHRLYGVRAGTGGLAKAGFAAASHSTPATSSGEDARTSLVERRTNRNRGIWLPWAHPAPALALSPRGEAWPKLSATSVGP